MYFAHWKLRRIFMPKKENVISSNQKWRSPRKTQSWQFAIMSLPIKELKRRKCVNQGSFLRKKLMPLFATVFSLMEVRFIFLKWPGSLCLITFWAFHFHSMGHWTKRLFSLPPTSFQIYLEIQQDLNRSPRSSEKKIKNLSLNTNPSWRKEWR